MYVQILGYAFGSEGNKIYEFALGEVRFAENGGRRRMFVFHCIEYLDVKVTNL